MAESIFDDKSQAPTVPELEKALGKSTALLKNIEADLGDQLGEIKREWKFYSKKAGLTFALIHRGRRLFHLIPRSGFFTLVITLGTKAVLESRTIGLPTEIISAIENTKEYAEGKSIHLDISSEKDITSVKKLVMLKVSS